jgi:hypothetical protein
MFDKLGDMAKLAQEARSIQERQDRSQREQLDILRQISGKLDQVIDLLKKK